MKHILRFLSFIYSPLALHRFHHHNLRLQSHGLFLKPELIIHDYMSLFIVSHFLHMNPLIIDNTMETQDGLAMCIYFNMKQVGGQENRIIAN